MFRKMLLQLTSRSAAAFFIILVTLGISLYADMHHLLFARVDVSLMSMIGRRPGIGKSIVQGSPPQTSTLSIALKDRPALRLYWQPGNRLLAPGLAEYFSPDQLDLFAPSRFGDKPETIRVGDQYFRVLTLNVNDVFDPVAPEGGPNTRKIEKVQFVLNVSAEVNMLRNLLYVLLIGGGIGLIVAALTGLYLARRAIVPIRKSWKLQQQFVSDASHELRTPLAVIRAHTELLLRHPERTIEQESEYISTILKEAKRLSRLVDGLLTLSRADSNQAEINRKPVQVDTIVREAVNQTRYLAELKKISVRMQLGDNVRLNGDGERLHQLMIILLDNAVKYTQQYGCVRIALKKNAQVAVIEVEDTGIGIPEGDLPRIFDRFYRGDKTRGRADGGVGLGLAIAKWIVERHGGKIQAESKPGTGTRMRVFLPL